MTTIVYTGDGKGKTSAGLGLLCRALGAGNKVAFVQFIKKWHVSEDSFLESMSPVYKERLVVHKGGMGFFNAGDKSAKNVTRAQHVTAARETYELVYEMVSSGQYDLVICDEINNAVHDGLLKVRDITNLLEAANSSTDLCMTGRNFPKSLAQHVDIISEIKKVRHHYDNGVIAQKGIDF